MSRGVTRALGPREDVAMTKIPARSTFFSVSFCLQVQCPLVILESVGLTMLEAWALHLLLLLPFMHGSFPERDKGWMWACKICS